MTAPDHPDPDALRAAAARRIQDQITAAANKRTAAKTRRAQRAATRTAGLLTRHRTRSDYLSNHTPTATAA